MIFVKGGPLMDARLKKIIDEEHSPNGYSVSIGMHALAEQVVDHVGVELVAIYKAVKR